MSQQHRASRLSVQSGVLLGPKGRCVPPEEPPRYEAGCEGPDRDRCVGGLWASTRARSASRWPPASSSPCDLHVWEVTSGFPALIVVTTNEDCDEEHTRPEQLLRKCFRDRRPADRVVSHMDRSSASAALAESASTTSTRACSMTAVVIAERPRGIAVKIEGAEERGPDPARPQGRLLMSPAGLAGTGAYAVEP